MKIYFLKKRKLHFKLYYLYLIYRVRVPKSLVEECVAATAESRIPVAASSSSKIPVPAAAPATFPGTNVGSRRLEKLGSKRY